MTELSKDADVRTWRFCATVDEARQLIGIAQRVGVPVELTTVRVDSEGPHSACAESLARKGTGPTDGYEVRVGADASAEAVAMIWTELQAAVLGCVVMSR